MLFDDLQRSDPSPRAHEAESSFAFLNRVNTPFWAEVRRTLEVWFKRYPQAGREELRERYRSKREGQHRAAWWELYLHELFCRLGYEVRLHPELPDTSARPDFELRGPGSRLLVEATVVFSGIVAGESERGAPDWLLEAIEGIEAPDFFVLVEAVEQRGQRRLKRRQVIQPVQAWLDRLDPDAVSAAHRGEAELPRYQLDCGGWRIALEAIPVKREARGKPGHRVYGGGPAMGGAVNDVEQLYDKLRDKAGRYGRPEVPLVTAVLCTSAFMEGLDIEQALFGREAIEFGGERGGTSRLIRQPNGFWFRGEKPINQRVSAVLSAVALHEANAPRVAPHLWLNPWANRPFDVDWPFGRSSANDRGRVSEEAAEPDMASLLGLAPGWPGARSFPRSA